MSDPSVLEDPKKFDKALAKARKELIKLDNVLGVGYGYKETKGKSTGEVAIVVFVSAKKRIEEIDPKQRVPPEFDGVRTDVVELGKRELESHDDSDMMFLDSEKVHRENLENIERAKSSGQSEDPDFGNLAVVLDDGAIVTTTGWIDYIHAYELFRDTHPDVYDFVIFFHDTSSGFPSSGSFHRAIYNATSGINYYAGGTPASPYNIRAAWGSKKLLAMDVISPGAWSWPGRMGTILQEVGHYWSAFERFKHYETETADHLDLLRKSIVPTDPQGLFHWSPYFDNGHSPVDYDGVDWNDEGNGRFAIHVVDNSDFYYCNLDLYNMGLLSPDEVGLMHIIKDPHPPTPPTAYPYAPVYGGKQELTVDNVVWAHGERNPDYRSSQKLFKAACIILTKDVDKAAHNVVPVLDDVRKEFTWQYYKATGFRGKLDTTISPELRTFVS